MEDVMLTYQDIEWIDRGSLSCHAGEDEFVILEGVDDIDDRVVLDFKEEETDGIQFVC